MSTNNVYYVDMKKRFNDFTDGKIDMRQLHTMVYDTNNVALALRQLSKAKGRMAKGQDGTNYQTLADYSIAELSKIVKDRLFNKKMDYVRRTYIPKGKTGEMRPLGICSVWDKLVEKCIQLVIEPYCETKFVNSSFEFQPEFKIFINTNHLPIVSDATIFASKRVKLIPFERHFEPNEQDRGLKRNFRKTTSMSGILNWLIEGYGLMLSSGLDNISPRMTATITDYKVTDTSKGGLGAFIAENLVPISGARTKTSLLYKHYIIWANAGEWNCMRSQDFVGGLRECLNVKHDYLLGNYVLGYEIKS